MPNFANPFSGNNNDRKLTKDELIRAIRFSIASEYEAIQLYEQLEESIDDEKAKKILNEITGDEKVHVGNFYYLLKTIAPEEDVFYKQGCEEAVKTIYDDTDDDDS